MRVKQLESPRSGKAVPNQFVITDRDGTEYFQTYDTNIVARRNGKIYLDEVYYNYSVTTSKYRNQYLGCTTAELNERIKSGEYTLTNLNKDRG
jgi:hypothetical protein